MRRGTFRFVAQEPTLAMRATFTAVAPFLVPNYAALDFGRVHLCDGHYAWITQAVPGLKALGVAAAAGAAIYGSQRWNRTEAVADAGAGAAASKTDPNPNDDASAAGTDGPKGDKGHTKPAKEDANATTATSHQGTDDSPDKTDTGDAAEAGGASRQDAGGPGDQGPPWWVRRMKSHDERPRALRRKKYQKAAKGFEARRQAKSRQAKPGFTPIKDGFTPAAAADAREAAAKAAAEKAAQEAAARAKAQAAMEARADEERAAEAAAREAAKKAADEKAAAAAEAAEAERRTAAELVAAQDYFSRANTRLDNARILARRGKPLVDEQGKETTLIKLQAAARKARTALGY